MEVDEQSPESNLFRACEELDEGAVAELLQELGPLGLCCRDAEGRTPLLAACSAGGLGLVRMLLEGGASADDIDEEGRGLALLTAESGSCELLTYLLEQGLVDLTECAEDGSTALLCAAGAPEDNLQMVSYLLEGPSGALATPSWEERDDRGANALLVAAEAGAVAVARELLRRGASLDITDENGCGVLHYAAAAGSIPMMQFCIKELGIAADARDNDGDTPMLIAAHEGHVEAIEWLLKNGSSLQERNADGMSAALAAAAGEQGDVLKALARIAGQDAVLQEINLHPQLVLNFLEKGI